MAGSTIGRNTQGRVVRIVCLIVIVLVTSHTSNGCAVIIAVMTIIAIRDGRMCTG
jgi:hypothetical protein